MFILLAVVLVCFLLYSFRELIILKFCKFIDPVTGKDLRDLGYELIYVRKNEDYLELKRGQILVIKKDGIDNIQVNDIIYIEDLSYEYNFWKVKSFDSKAKLAVVEKDNDVGMRISLCNISGVVVGKEESCIRI